jgi:hypothetical protein
LVEQGQGEDLMDDFKANSSVTLACRSRGSIGYGNWFEEDEVSKVIVLLDLHEQQLARAKRSELAASLIESYKRAA